MTGTTHPPIRRLESPTTAPSPDLLDRTFLEIQLAIRGSPQPNPSSAPFRKFPAAGLQTPTEEYADEMEGRIVFRHGFYPKLPALGGHRSTRQGRASGIEYENVLSHEKILITFSSLLCWPSNGFPT
jgi:hypothetical protein